MTANYKCPQCGGTLEGEASPFTCARCGTEVTEYERIVETAETVRSEGFDELADRLEAAAEVAREGAENGA